MSNYVQWSGIGGSSNEGSGKNDFLQLETGKIYQVRLLFYPYKFWKYFYKNNGKLRTAICQDPDTCPVKDRHDDLKKPVLRFAVYVIDKADGKVKILEAPLTVFSPIRDYAEAVKKNPGDLDTGSEWQIKKTGSGLQTKYHVTFLAEKPLTPEEKQKVKEALGENPKRLKEIYPVDTPEQIEKKLFGAEDAGDSEPSETPSASKQTVASASAPAGANEFNW